MMSHLIFNITKHGSLYYQLSFKTKGSKAWISHLRTEAGKQRGQDIPLWRTRALVLPRERCIKKMSERQNVGYILSSPFTCQQNGFQSYLGVDKEEVSLSNYKKNQAHEIKGISNTIKKQLLKDHFLLALLTPKLKTRLFSLRWAQLVKSALKFSQINK